MNWCQMEVGIIYIKANKWNYIGTGYVGFREDTHVYSHKYFFKKFMPRDRAYKVLKNKSHEVEKGKTGAWKEAFGILTPSIKVREG